MRTLASGLRGLSTTQVGTERKKYVHKAAFGRAVGEFRKCTQFLDFFSLIPSVHARPFHALSAHNRHHHPAWSRRWSPCRCCSVRFDATSTSDFESRPKACSQPPAGGSGHRRFVHSTGRIDVLVNNAASFYAGYFDELTPEQMERQLVTSLIGPMNVIRAVLQVMRKQR
jgi:hypothetical protein